VCRNILAMSCASYPCSAMSAATSWRSMCGLAYGTPARPAAGLNTRRVHARRSYGLPASLGKIRSSSVRRSRRGGG
jgi:hypothetical protein